MAVLRKVLGEQFCLWTSLGSEEAVNINYTSLRGQAGQVHKGTQNFEPEGTLLKKLFILVSLLTTSSLPCCRPHPDYLEDHVSHLK